MLRRGTCVMFFAAWSAYYSAAQTISVQQNTLSEAPEGMVFAEPAAIAISNVLVAAVMMREKAGPKVIRVNVYRSIDSGRSWENVTPEALNDLTLAVDPWLGVGADGTLYLVVLAHVKDPGTGGNKSEIYVFHSADRGISWVGPALVSCGAFGCDKPSVVVDNSGRVEVIALQNWSTPGNDKRQGVISARSVDRGKSFEIVSRYGPNNVSLNVGQPPVVTSDNTLWSPVFEIIAQGAKAFLEHPRLWVWGLPPAGPELGPYLVSESIEAVPPSLAVDRSELYRDRLYVTWTGPKSDRQIYLAYSDDRARTWSSPVRISGSAPPRNKRYKAMVVVNSQGVVATAWRDSRDDPDDKCTHVYFSASIDAGKSFSLLTRVSQGPTCYADWWGDDGEYFALAAAADQRFYLVWPENRNSRSWLRGAAVTVGAQKLESSNR